MAGFGMNLRGMPHIRSFEQAQAHWAAQEPWRNEHSSWRPLQNRRKRHVRMIKLHDELGYECVLYNTPMVTYYTDGTVKLISHDSVSSHEFAWRVTPPGISPVGSNGNGMFWEIDTPEGERFYKDHYSLLLAPTPGSTWSLLNEPLEMTDKVLDRKVAATVRKHLSHYAKWEKLTSRLLNNHVYSSFPTRNDVRLLLERPEDPEVFAKLRIVLGPVENFRQLAYELAGAYDEVVVPHDRLPRRQK